MAVPRLIMRPEGIGRLKESTGRLTSGILQHSEDYEVNVLTLTF